MNKTLKTIVSVISVISLFLAVSVFTVAQAEEAFTATFVTDEFCSITTYETSDYSAGASENQTLAVARDSATGLTDTSGNGQINFTVVTASGYTVDSVEVEGAYKNLKGPADTGKENTYRITKISGDLTVTVKTTSDSPATQYSETAEIEFSENSVSVTPLCSNVTISQTDVTITQEGTYTISGSCEEGSLTVAKNSGNVTLILNSLNLKSSTTAPVSAKSGTSVTVIACGTNTLTDTDRGAVSPKSCINSSGNLIFGGSGILNVNGNNKNGIKADGDLTINELTLNVSATDNAIAADNVLTVSGGSITANSAGGDCLKADPDAITAATLGNIIINAGKISLTASAGDAIQALGTLTINDGDITVCTGGGYKTAPTDEISTKGIKSDSGLIINGGTFNINSSDDAVHSNSDVTITGGTFNIYTGDDAVHSDALLTLKNAQINVFSSYEALEGKDITIESGKYILTSSDDGINAVGTKTEASTSTATPGMPGMPGGMGGMQKGDALLTVNGGYIYIKADGDGIDSNGNVVMNNGTVLVVGSKNGGDGALDYDSDFKMNGGTVIALGQSNMAQSVSSDTICVMNIRLKTKVSANTAVYLNDENSNTVFAFKTDRAYDSIVIASDKLEKGKTYTLYTGGTISGEGENGFWLSGAVCTGGASAYVSTATSASNTGDSLIQRLLNRILEFFRKILSFFRIGQ